MNPVVGVAPASAGVLRAGPEHAEDLAAFYREVWDSNATAQRVRESRDALAGANPHGAGTDIPTFLFFDKGRVVGHVTTIPVQLWCKGQSIAAHWLKGLMVLPEYRNGPIGYLVLRHALEQLDVTLAAVVAPDARRLFSALGFSEIGAVPNPVRILDSTKVLRRIGRSELKEGLRPALRTALKLSNNAVVSGVAGLAGDAVLRAYSAIAGMSVRRAILLERFPTDTELNTLWQRARDGLTHAIQRDAAYLRAHYHAADYRWIGVRDGQGLGAFAALRLPRAHGDARLLGIKVATIADIVVHPADQQSLRALLHAAHQVARNAGADAVLCSASHPALLRSLYRTGYLPYSGNVRILLREGSATGITGALNEWWLTRGDGSADEAF